jgi:predicted lipoprotein with Yx(FWY)xxD motif
MRTLTIAGTLLGLTLVVAACSSGGGATTAPATAAPASEAPASSAPASQAPASAGASEAPAGAAPSINLGDTSLGSVVVDGTSGKTLYVFTADSGGASACYDKCAAAWPPLLTDGSAPTLGAGLDAEDFATIDRTDGTTQVTFYGMPLYFFAADAAAGDVKGQGLNDKWFVVDATGKQIK